MAINWGQIAISKIYLSSRLKSGSIEAFQVAISTGNKKNCYPLYKCQRTRGLSLRIWSKRTAVSHGQNLKTIIGTGTRDRLLWGHRASMGLISYSALAHGTPPSIKTQSKKGMNYWFCYRDHFASLSSLTLCNPTIPLKGIWRAKKALAHSFDLSPVLPRWNPHHLTSQGRLWGGWGREEGLQCIPNISVPFCLMPLPTGQLGWDVTFDMLTSKGRASLVEKRSGH